MPKVRISPITGFAKMRVGMTKTVKKQLKEAINPYPTKVRISATPPAIRSPDTVYLTKRLRIILSQPSDEPIPITTGMINSQIYFSAATGQTCSFRVLRAYAWNTTNSSQNTNQVAIIPASSSFYSGVSPGKYEDYGAGGTAPAVGVEFPRTLTTLQEAVKGGSTTVLTVDGVGNNNGTAAVQQVICDLVVEYRA
jgi:hypothetical protein